VPPPPALALLPMLMGLLLLRPTAPLPG